MRQRERKIIRGRVQELGREREREEGVSGVRVRERKRRGKRESDGEDR